MVIREIVDNIQCIILQPNRSATWRQTLYFVISISVISLFIAIFWAIQGAWLILPFAGIEILLLCYLTYRVCASTYTQQVLKFSSEEILVETGRTTPKFMWKFKRSESKFIITRPEHSLSAAKIELVAEDQCIRIGEDLNKEDIETLIQFILHSGIQHKLTGTTKTISLKHFDN